RDPRPRDPHLPDVARVHFRVLGNLRLDAALYGERRREGRPAGAAMGELRRDGLQRCGHHRLCRIRLPCRCLWPQAGHNRLFCARVSFGAGLLHLDPGSDASAVGRSVQRDLCIRPVHLDVGVAAGAVPDARARDRHRVRVQHAAPDFMDRSADLGLADREFRRLQPSPAGDGDGLDPGPRGGFPARDARKAAAGVVMRRQCVDRLALENGAACDTLTRARELKPRCSRRRSRDRSRMRSTMTAAAMGIAVASHAAAQDWPARPITLIVPFAAGGGIDVSARIQAQHMGELLGQSIVIENVGAAAGMAGGARVAKAAPDGYTLLIGNTGTHAFNQSLYKKPLYEAATDFEPVGLVSESPRILIARKDLPADNLT